MIASEDTQSAIRMAASDGDGFGAYGATRAGAVNAMTAGYYPARRFIYSGIGSPAYYSGENRAWRNIARG
jgi:hypothetical protein